MQELVRQAMREGALGFSTSQLDIHVGEDGREVPCNHAEPRRDPRALRRCWRSSSAARVEIIPRSIAAGYDEARSPADPRHVPRLGPADRAQRPPADAGESDELGAHAGVRARGCRRRRPPAPAVHHQRARPAPQARRHLHLRRDADLARGADRARAGALAAPARSARCARSCAPSSTTSADAPRRLHVGRARGRGGARRRARRLGRPHRGRAGRAQRGVDPLDAFLDCRSQRICRPSGRRGSTRWRSAFIEHVVRSRRHRSDRHVRLERRRRPPGLVRRRRLHHPPAHRLGARPAHASSRRSGA